MRASLLKVFILFIYLFLAVLGLRCCEGFSLFVVSRSYSPVAAHGLLIAVASLVAEHRLNGQSLEMGCPIYFRL